MDELEKLRKITAEQPGNIPERSLQNRGGAVPLKAIVVGGGDKIMISLRQF